ncbi:hypothetical protein [Prevotella sp. HJM029]|uniref:hypothetical protein n=1 Tax=Prevotella sp. HJM029 TaxID=1433844 RepID=UPI00048E7875|nr:hypothetical protein [Prevotella sp. HJM029]
MKIVAIARDRCFSPHSVENDYAILQAVVEGLQQPVVWVTEEQVRIAGLPPADLYLTMARSAAVLQQLAEAEKAGKRVVNAAESVAQCVRSVLHRALQAHAIPLPPTEGNAGYWLKRGDASAQEQGDVVFCRDKEALTMQQQLFVQRGITDWVVEAHLPGDLLKFYGVAGGFFQYFYPSDDGISKFGDEQRNGLAHHYAFDAAQLQAMVEQVAALTGVEVYGGDVIVAPSGNFFLIDFNDWPSFSRCREAAAKAIVAWVKDNYLNETK